MVRIMQLKNTNQYINKTTIDSAPKLHQLFNKDSAPFEMPTARDIILERLTWNKWFSIELKDIAPTFDEDAESQELCKLINVDWQDLDVSVIDEFLANKQSRVMQSKRLTFKDFRLV